MKLGAIFQYILEHLIDFQTISYDGNFVFQMRLKIFTGKTFAVQDCPWFVLYFEAIGAIIREI